MSGGAIGQGQGSSSYSGAPSMGQRGPTGATPLTGQALARQSAVNYGFAPQPNTVAGQNFHAVDPSLYGGGWNALSQMMAGPSYQMNSMPYGTTQQTAAQAAAAASALQPQIGSPSVPALLAAARSPLGNNYGAGGYMTGAR